MLASPVSSVVAIQGTAGDWAAHPGGEGYVDLRPAKDCEVIQKTRSTKCEEALPTPSGVDSLGRASAVGKWANPQ